MNGMLTANCTSCHELDKVTAARKDKDGWVDQVEMCTSGGLDSEDAEKIVEFLAEKYGE